MAEFYDAWRPSISGITVENDWKAHCPFSPQSPPVSLPGALDGGRCVLPLFSAVSANSAAPGSSGDSSLSQSDALDLVANAGGPVWALDWCPASVSLPAGGSTAAANGQPSSSNANSDGSSSRREVQYIAVGCHPLHLQTNQINKAVRGPCMVQLWEVCDPMQPASQLRLPCMALGLAHNGGLAWQCRWCPNAALADALTPSSSGGSSSCSGDAVLPDALPRLGLLAAVLGDGSLRVWVVPQPHAVHQHLAVDEPAVVSLDPVVHLTSQQLNGSMPALVDWLPSPPHDLLLIGCWDGTVAIARLTTPQQQQAQQHAAAHGTGGGGGGSGHAPLGLELLLHFVAEPCPLRSVRWAPAEVCASSLDQAGRHTFLTAGHEGVLRIWDARDQFQPLYCHTLSAGSAVYGALWTRQPFGILATMEDASLRGILLDSQLIADNAAKVDKAMFTITWRGNNMGALWSLDEHPRMHLVAYAGEDGEVGVFQAAYEGDSRKRLAHTAVAATRQADDALVLLAPGQIRHHGLFAGRVAERNKNMNARLPEETEAVHRVAWSPVGDRAAWLASAGAAGLVRLQWVKLT